MDKQEKQQVLFQIQKDREKIRQKILYHLRCIDKLTINGWYDLGLPKKKLQHREKIGLLLADDKRLENERLRILHL